MTAYDTRARATAARKLAPVSLGGKGQAVTLIRKANGSYNVTTLTQATNDTTQDTSGLEEAFRASQIDGTLIKAGDKKFLMSPVKIDQSTPLSPEPEAGDLVTIGGADWVVISNEKLAPAGLSIMHTLHLRGA